MTYQLTCCLPGRILERSPAVRRIVVLAVHSDRLPRLATSLLWNALDHTRDGLDELWDLDRRTY